MNDPHAVEQEAEKHDAC